MGLTVSGKQVIAILQRDFGFTVKRQRGSHVTLRRTGSRTHAVTVVPLHKELAPGTLRSVLKLARITQEQFTQALKR